MPAESLELLLDNPEMYEAVSVIFDRSDGGTEELRWTDVKDALSSGQWGRLIERGVLQDGATGGFVLASPDCVSDALESQADEASDGLELRWSWYDKLGAVGVVVLFLGYSNTGIRNVVASADNVLLGPLDATVPFYAVVLLLSVVTGLYSTVIQDRLTDSELMQAHQSRMSDLKERLNAAKEQDDEEAIERIEAEQMEAMKDQGTVMKAQFRPMVWIMLVTIPVFLWLRWKVRGGHIAASDATVILPLLGRIGWQDAAFGPMPTWIVWYFLCSFAARQVFQKFLDVDPTGKASSDSPTSQ